MNDMIDENFEIELTKLVSGTALFSGDVSTKFNVKCNKEGSKGSALLTSIDGNSENIVLDPVGSGKITGFVSSLTNPVKVKVKGVDVFMEQVILGFDGVNLDKSALFVFSKGDDIMSYSSDNFPSELLNKTKTK